MAFFCGPCQHGSRCCSRAKAKLQNTKQKGRGGSAEVPPDSPPQLSTGFEVDLHNLIHEDERRSKKSIPYPLLIHPPLFLAVTIIPCTDLSIGTWRRIATTSGKHDLVAYVCDIKKCLIWFIHSAGFGFKMEIPFETILKTSFTNAAPGSGLASFQLSQPPIFYLENAESPDTEGASGRFWKRCSDWTEGHQATAVLHHELIGSAPQLAHVLRSLAANREADIPLRHISYREEPPASPMELPPPPMAGLTGPGYHYQPEVADTDTLPHDVCALSRKRSLYDTPDATTHSPDSVNSNDGDRPPLYTIHAGNSISHHLQYPAAPHRMAPTASDFLTCMHKRYVLEAPVAPHSSGHHGQQVHLNSYTAAPASHGLAPRPYVAQPVPRTFYSEVPQLTQDTYTGDMHTRNPNPVESAESSYLQPSSPPLLTTPYHPPPHLLENIPSHNEHHHHSIAAPIISGLPPVYSDLHRHHDR